MHQQQIRVLATDENGLFDAPHVWLLVMYPKENYTINAGQVHHTFPAVETV